MKVELGPRFQRGSGPAARSSRDAREPRAAFFGGVATGSGAASDPHAVNSRRKLNRRSMEPSVISPYPSLEAFGSSSAEGAASGRGRVRGRGRGRRRPTPALARALHQPVRGEAPVQVGLLVDVAIDALRARDGNAGGLDGSGARSESDSRRRTLRAGDGSAGMTIPAIWRDGGEAPERTLTTGSTKTVFANAVTGCFCGETVGVTAWSSTRGAAFARGSGARARFRDLKPNMAPDRRAREGISRRESGTPRRVRRRRSGARESRVDPKGSSAARLGVRRWSTRDAVCATPRIAMGNSRHLGNAVSRGPAVMGTRANLRIVRPPPAQSRAAPAR